VKIVAESQPTPRIYHSIGRRSTVTAGISKKGKIFKMVNELYHHGVLGMKWGVRRYQNADGSYTEAGRKRYGIKSSGTKKSGRESMQEYLSKKSHSTYKDPTTMSDDELERSVNRKRKETEYMRLSSQYEENYDKFVQSTFKLNSTKTQLFIGAVGGMAASAVMKEIASNPQKYKGYAEALIKTIKK